MLKRERNRITNASKNGGQLISERPLSDQGDQSGRRVVGRRDVTRGVVRRQPTSSRGESSDDNTPTAPEEREQPEASREEANGQLQRNRPSTSRQMADDMSQGRREAFDVFRSDYPHNPAIEENKQTLKQRYGEAKSLGEQVNKSRKRINTLKTQIEQHRIRRSMKVADDDDDDEEDRLRNAIEEEKSRYKNVFTRLRSLKTEIEHLQHLLEKSKVQMQKDFEEWWTEQSSLPQKNQNGKVPHPTTTAWKTPTPPLSPIKPQESRGRAASFETRHRVSQDQARVADMFGSRLQTEARLSSSGATNTQSSSNYVHPDLSGTSGGSSRDGQRLSSNFKNGREAYESAKQLNSSNASSSLKLTGDSRADDDIMAFIRARQTLLDQKGSNQR